MPTRPDRRQVGSAAVEFALVLPLVLVMALALVQVGLLVRDRLLVESAARAGAQVQVWHFVNGTLAHPPCPGHGRGCVPGRMARGRMASALVILGRGGRYLRHVPERSTSQVVRSSSSLKVRR
jgi:TadE-like protein